MIGDYIPEHEPSWEILMEQKETVQIVLSNRLSEETLCYLSFKLADHHLPLHATFPDFDKMFWPFGGTVLNTF